MKRSKILLAAVMCGAPISAQAQLVTRNFIGTAVFTDGGPVTNIGFAFGVTYDPAAGTFFNKQVNYYTTTTQYASFNTPGVTFARSGNNIYINGDQDGNGFGFGLASFKPDFELDVTDLPPVNLRPLAFSVFYSIGDGTASHLAGNQLLNSLVEVTANAAVPEPATWGLMMLGFGAVGTAMRYRRRGVRVRFA